MIKKYRKKPVTIEAIIKQLSQPPSGIKDRI